MKLKKVLVPLDFTRYSNSTIRFAIQFAADTKCKLIFFHSSPDLIPTSLPPGEYERTVREAVGKKEKALMSKIARICTELNIPIDSVDLDFVVRTGGSVSDHLITVIEDERADLLLMATRRRKGLEKLLFGSITAKLIAVSPVPVLAIPVNYVYHRIERIIYSSDLKDYKAELKQVRALAGALNAAVEVLTFDHEPSVTEKEVERLKGERVTFTRSTVDDMPLVEHLEKYMKEKPGAILCMFTHSGNRIKKIVTGSKTEEIGMDLHFPLLALHKQAVVA